MRTGTCVAIPALIHKRAAICFPFISDEGIIAAYFSRWLGTWSIIVFIVECECNVILDLTY